MTVYRDCEGSVILLVDSQNRVAMQLRDDKLDLPAANQWGLFGGLSGEDETPETVILREIHEELCVRLNPKKLSFYRKHYLPDQNLTTWIFRYPVTDELENAVLQEGQMWDFIGVDDPRAGNIGLHHHEIVLDFWNNRQNEIGPN
jgi:8-oxo-dGTP pyrophosphatase MutT (NUDIX family)